MGIIITGIIHPLFQISLSLRNPTPLVGMNTYKPYNKNKKYVFQ